MVKKLERASLDAMFSSEKDDWETPKDFFLQLDDEFHFTLDAAANPENALCKRYFTKDDNALLQDWGSHVVWVNPPYGDQVRPFVEKANDACSKGATVVMLVPSRTDTVWFHEFILQKKHEIRFIKGRLRFCVKGVPYPKGSAPFPSVVVVMRPKKEGKE